MRIIVMRYWFEVDEDKKSQERMYDLMEKLNGKIKTYKRQLEEAVSNFWFRHFLSWKFLDERYTITLCAFQTKTSFQLQEELATNNLTKYRQLQHQLEVRYWSLIFTLIVDQPSDLWSLQEAQERADTAENALHKARAQQRSGSGFFGRSVGHNYDLCNEVLILTDGCSFQASSTTINFARSSSRSFMRNLNTDTIEE